MNRYPALRQTRRLSLLASCFFCCLFCVTCADEHVSLTFSSQAITTPAMAVSHIMLEAYKKYILVSLILHGKVQPLPKYTSQIVGRFIKVRANSWS